MVRRLFLWLLQAVQLGEAAFPNPVNKIDNRIIFLNTLAVEVLSYRTRQVYFCLTALVFFPRHGWGVQADAARLGQDPGAVVACVGGGGLEIVFATVAVEDIAIKGGPLDLEKMRRTSQKSVCYRARIWRVKGGVRFREKNGLTLGFGTGAVVATSAAGVGKLAAFCTSLRFEPV